MLNKAMMSVWFDTQSVIIVSSCVPKEEELVSSENSASIFNTLSDLPSQLEDGAAVLGEAVRLAGSLSQDNLDAHRHKHLAYILAEQAQLNSNSHSLHTNLNKVRSWKASLTILCDAHSLTHPNDKIQNLIEGSLIVVCHCAGGPQTEPAQEIHPELAALGRGRGGGDEGQKH